MRQVEMIKLYYQNKDLNNSDILNDIFQNKEYEFLINSKDDISLAKSEIFGFNLKEERSINFCNEYSINGIKKKQRKKN